MELRPFHIVPAVLSVLFAVAILLFVSCGEASTLEIISSFPRNRYDLDEDEKERKERLATMAEAIDAATDNSSERKLLIAQAWHESRFAAYVQNDAAKCREGHGGRCDNGLAWSPWQLHGTDRQGTMQWAAREALSLLRYHARRCKKPGLNTVQSVIAAISGYATGGSCRWSGATKRAKTWERML